jgi:SAM-dependent methyltransferase
MIKVNNDLVHLRCPLCNSSEIKMIGVLKYSRDLIFSTHEIILKNKPELWKCRSCNSGFTQYAIDKQTAEELYSSGEGSKRWSSAVFDKDATVINYFSKVLKHEMNVLDIGCNTGEFLDFAKDRGCHTYGVELSDDSIKVLEKKNHIAKNNMDFGDIKFDFVVAFDLIEHLYDVNGFLRQSKSLLKPQGILVILTGNINSISSLVSRNNWWYVNYPEHVVFPSRNFFKVHSLFAHIGSLKCYASKIRSEEDRIGLSNVRGIFSNNYNGIPSFGPDHLLISLS